MIAVILRKAGLLAFSDRDVLKHLFVGPVPNETSNSCAIFCVFDEIARNENHLRKFFKVTVEMKGSRGNEARSTYCNKWIEIWMPDAAV